MSDDAALIAITDRAQAIAQLSPTSEATATRWWRLCGLFDFAGIAVDRAVSTSSLARCRVQIPGETSARSSASRDSVAECARRRHWVSVQCRSTRSRARWCARARDRDLLGPDLVADTVKGVSESAGQPGVPGRSNRSAESPEGIQPNLAPRLTTGPLPWRAGRASSY